MKYIARLAVIATTVSLTAHAAPFMAVGDGAELFVTSKLSVQFDDNIYLDGTNEQDDTIFTFTPGLDLVFGKGSTTTGNVYFTEEIRRYSNNDVQNDELPTIGFNSSTDTGSAKYDFNASYAEVAQNDNDLRATGSIIRRSSSNLGAKGEFDVTGKTSVGVGASYASTNYDAASYTDSSTWSIPVDVYYAATEKLDWSLGYRYRNTAQDGAARDLTDHFVNVGARGEFTPKISGQVRVGYNSRAVDGGKDETGLGLDTSVGYAATEKTSLDIFLSNDFGNSGVGESTKVLRYGGSITSNLTEQWIVTASLGMTSTKYPSRDDDYLDGLVSVSYKYSQYLDFSASLAMKDNSSSSALSEFTNTVFTFGANVRY